MPPSLVQRISDCFTRRQARPRSTRSRTSQRELLPPIGFRSWPAAPSSTRPTRSCQPRPAPVDGCGRTHASGYDRSTMSLPYRAAVLHEPRTPLAIEQVTATALAPSDVLVRVRAAGLCHTDLEVIDGSLRYPMPIVLGHEAAGVIEQVGPAVSKVRKGDHVVLSWNPHCGHCFYCDRDLPILCEDYLAKGAQAVQFDGESKARLASGAELKHLMFLGAFGEYCIVPEQQAIAVPAELPFDRACLIGCG